MNEHGRGAVHRRDRAWPVNLCLTCKMKLPFTTVSPSWWRNN